MKFTQKCINLSTKISVILSVALILLANLSLVLGLHVFSKTEREATYVTMVPQKLFFFHTNFFSFLFFFLDSFLTGDDKTEHKNWEGKIKKNK